MDWREALEIELARTGHGRYRDLCADEHPDRDFWRAHVVERATGIRAEPPRAYPSVVTQAGNAIVALGRAVATGFRAVDPAEQSRRFAICETCPDFDPRQERCRLCGCVASLKARLESEHCPASKW